MICTFVYTTGISRQVEKSSGVFNGWLETNKETSPFLDFYFLLFMFRIFSEVSSKNSRLWPYEPMRFIINIILTHFFF